LHALRQDLARLICAQCIGMLFVWISSLQGLRPAAVLGVLHIGNLNEPTKRVDAAKATEDRRSCPQRLMMSLQRAGAGCSQTSADGDTWSPCIRFCPACALMTPAQPQAPPCLPAHKPALPAACSLPLPPGGQNGGTHSSGSCTCPASRPVEPQHAVHTEIEAVVVTATEHLASTRRALLLSGRCTQREGILYQGGATTR
jgi:hypothetical protein